MNVSDRTFIHEYNYPETHSHKLMYGTHDVIAEEGSCYRIMIDDYTYFMSKYDMTIIEELPEELFTI